MNVLSKRSLLGAALLIVTAAAVTAGVAIAGSKGAHRLRERPRTDQRSAASRPPDRGERDPGEPEQRVGAPAALPGHREQRHAERGEGLVRPARRPEGNRARPGCQLCVQARQPRDRRPGGRAERDGQVADTRPEQVRAGGRRLPGRAGLQPEQNRGAQPTGFPLANFQPGAVAGPGYSPFIRITGSETVYSAPIVATGDGPFDVVHHSNTGDRVLGVHIAGPSAPGQFAESWVDLLFVKGFDAGQPIVYISTDAGQPLTSVLERSTYVPALDKAPYNGGDDFLGSARERLFGFINGQTGAGNEESQGFVHLIKDGHASEDASASNTALIDALRNGGDLLNVFGDFPTEKDPRHADAYSPLWDAQLGLWTNKAVQQGLNKRQIDEVQVFNLAATRPDLLTGINPATGQPAPYGSVGVDINCAVIGFIDKPPTANLADPVAGSQFPPR